VTRRRGETNATASALPDVDLGAAHPLNLPPSLPILGGLFDSVDQRRTRLRKRAQHADYFCINNYLAEAVRLKVRGICILAGAKAARHRLAAANDYFFISKR